MPDIIWSNDKPASAESIESQILAELKAIRAALEYQNKPVTQNFEVKVGLSPERLAQLKREEDARAAEGTYG
jgi:hypothetical protein